MAPVARSQHETITQKFQKAQKKPKTTVPLSTEAEAILFSAECIAYKLEQIRRELMLRRNK